MANSAYSDSSTGSWVVGILIAVIFAIFGGIMWANSVNVGPGDEIVLIKQPLLFGAEGVDPTSYRSGRVFTAPTTVYKTVNMQPLQQEVDFNDMMTKDGVPITFHAIIRLQVTDSVKLIRDFGADWYQKNVNFEFQKQMRQAVRQHGMNETAIATTAVDAIDKEVSDAMEAYFKSSGLPVKLVAVTMGRANPPDAIKTQRIETANQEQRKVTEERRKLAEDSRLAAETSRAAADNAYRNAMSLDPNQFISLERIHMMKDVCSGERKGACTFIIGGSSDILPTYNVGGPR